MSARDRLTGPTNTGVWYFTDAMSAGQAGEAAARIESLGYSTLWVPETLGRDPFAHLAWLGSQTTTLQFATGIASIFHRHPGPMLQAANTLAEQTGGRFVLGLGVSHGPMVEGIRKLDYSKPLSSDARLPGRDGQLDVHGRCAGRQAASVARRPRSEDARAVRRPPPTERTRTS